MNFKRCRNLVHTEDNDDTHTIHAPWCPVSRGQWIHHFCSFNMFLEGHKVRKVDPNPFTLMMLAPQHGEFDVGYVENQ